MLSNCICIHPDRRVVVTVLSSSHWRAREPRLCGECGCTIQVGEMYEADITSYGSTITVYKTCLLCVRVRQSLFKCGWYYNQVWAYVHEAVCGEGENGEPECVCPARWRDKIEVLTH